MKINQEEQVRREVSARRIVMEAIAEIIACYACAGAMPWKQIARAAHDIEWVAKRREKGLKV